MEERVLSKTTTEKKEEPYNSKAKRVDYEKEFYQLLEHMDDLGLQLQVLVKNTKIRLRPPEPQQAT